MDEIKSVLTDEQVVSIALSVSMQPAKDLEYRKTYRDMPMLEREEFDRMMCFGRAIERAVREATTQVQADNVLVPISKLEEWRNDLSAHGVGDIETAKDIELYAGKVAKSQLVSATQVQAIAWKTTHKSVFVPITQVPAIAEEWRKAGFEVIDLFDHAGPCQQNADAKRLWKTLQEVRNDFEREANRPKGQEAIVDTLWHGSCETLLDFIDNELEATKHLTHPYGLPPSPEAIDAEKQ